MERRSYTGRAKRQRLLLRLAVVAGVALTLLALCVSVRAGVC